MGRITPPPKFKTPEDNATEELKRVWVDAYNACLTSGKSCGTSQSIADKTVSHYLDRFYG